MLTKRTIFIWGTLGVLIAGAGGWWWLETSATPPPPFVQSAAPAPVAKLPQKQAIPPKNPPAPEVAPPQTVLTAGNLGKVTDIKGRIEVLKLEVQEEELKQKKKALSAPAPAPAATVPKFPELDLPAFATPSPARSTPRPSRPTAGTAVIAVQGVDGDLRAIVRTGTGTAVTVRKGMNFGGGVITDISRQGVLIRKNNTVTTLPFE